MAELAAISAILIALNEFRAAWWRAQHRHDHEKANSLYGMYRTLCDHYEDLTGDTRYHATNTVDDERNEAVKKTWG